MEARVLLLQNQAGRSTLQQVFGCPEETCYCGRAYEDGHPSSTRLCILWKRIGRRVQDWKNELIWIYSVARQKTSLDEVTSCVFAMMINTIWRARNSIQFQHIRPQPELLLKEFVQHLHTRGNKRA
ncbi:hypothetical protein HAX54_048485 [Datura stramonium]|uniref:Uncharacterized protein n=1 Tax=Datura stramonium TaxID=4076 RepID=A0ABS8RR07_DATST|nr:hypothetical protein [Datura stramonium]